MNIGSEIVGAKSVPISPGAGTTTVVAAVAGKQIRVLGYSLTGNNEAATIDFGDGASTWRAPGGGNTVAPISAAGWFETGAGLPLRITVAADSVAVGHISYQLVLA